MTMQPRRPFPAAMFATLLLLACQGCAGPAQQRVDIDPATGLPTGPINTGTYPDLNIRPTPANTQFTPAERAQNSSELSSRATAAQGAPTQPAAQTEATRAELEKSKTRGDEVLKEIEGGTN